MENLAHFVLKIELLLIMLSNFEREIGKPKKSMMRIDEGRFQFTRAKLDRDGEGGREDIGMGCCSVNI